MTEIEVRDLTADEARKLTDRIRAWLTEGWPLVKEAYERRAWLALGYPSWDAYCDAEVRGVRLPIEQRRQAVTALREAGMSTRAIGSALGVAARTVRNDLSAGGENSSPGPVVGVDGKRYEPTRPVREPAEPVPQTAWPPPEPVDDDWPPVSYAAAVEQFPELEHYADQPERAVTIAKQLAGMGEHEQRMRRDNLAKFMAAEKEGRLDKLRQPDPREELVKRADRIFGAVNAAAREVAAIGGVGALADAIAYADPMELETWSSQYADMAALCEGLARTCRPRLRRVQ